MTPLDCPIGLTRINHLDGREDLFAPSDPDERILYSELNLNPPKFR